MKDGTVIVVAATNAVESLDDALRRPGRFDRQVSLSLPSLEGRKRILQVHATKRKLSEGVDLEGVAREASGFSGAELENVMNEAAILAVRRKGDSIMQEDLHRAVDRVADGISESRSVKGQLRKNLAYYHAGQALVRSLLPDVSRPLRKVSLVQQPSGGLAYAASLLMAEDDGLVSQAELKANVAAMLGGRAAERLVLRERRVHPATTSACPDRC